MHYLFAIIVYPNFTKFMYRSFLVILSAFVFLFNHNSVASNKEKAVNFDYESKHGQEKLDKADNSNLKDLQKLKPRPNEQPLKIGTFFYDINGDGVDEMFIYVDDHLSCGTRGCATKIIDFSGKKPKEILNTHTYKRMRILKDKTNGYNNLGVEGDEETHIKSGFIILYWDGVQYRSILNPKEK